MQLVYISCLLIFLICFVGLSSGQQTPDESCDDKACNGGTCRLLYPGTGIKAYECLCSLFSTGQKCERGVKIPWVSIVIQLFGGVIVAVFIIVTYEMFNKKKINKIVDGVRFVDILQARLDDRMVDPKKEEKTGKEPKKDKTERRESRHRELDRQDSIIANLPVNNNITDISRKNDGGGDTVA